MTLSINNIGKRIKRDWIIRNISIEVNNGEIAAILGPSGCGKSTTLRLIAGLDKPDEGNIYIDGVDITNTPPMKRRVGMVFQSYALFPHLTVHQNLSLGLSVRGASAEEIKIRTSGILSLMKLEEQQNSLPSMLSGGQRQRVALARALLRDPLLFLLDEPMSNLDAQLREDLRPELRSLILKQNKPVLYVTHDQHEAMALATKIVILNNGQVEQIGTPKEIYQNPSSYFVSKFIGSPKINSFSSKESIITAIRPEEIRFDPNGIPSELIAKEWYGMNQVLLLSTKLGNLRMMCTSDVCIPQRINISWDKDKEFNFDRKTGKRINI